MRDHQELNGLLQRLADDSAAPEVGQLDQTWTIFERRLLTHLDAEEQLLLPLLEASHPAVVEHTRVEHEKIRARLAELGVSVELHTARRSDVLELIRLLEAHSAEEDHGLYDLVGERASVAVEHRLGALIKSALALARGATQNPFTRDAEPPTSRRAAG